MAMSITPVIGIAVGGRAGRCRRIIRRTGLLLQRQSARFAMSYMRDSLRKAKLVTHKINNEIVLWLDETTRRWTDK